MRGRVEVEAICNAIFPSFPFGRIAWDMPVFPQNT